MDGTCMRARTVILPDACLVCLVTYTGLPSTSLISIRAQRPIALMALNNGALGGRAYSSPSGRQVQQQHHHHHLHHNHGHLPHPPLYSSSSSSSSSAYPPVASTSSAVAGTQSDEFSEIKAVTLEWRLSDLKQIFDGSRGEAKSRWAVLIWRIVLP